MATAAIKVTPYVVFNQKGEFWFASAVEGLESPKDYVDDSGMFHIYGPTFIHEVVYPDDARQPCAALLRVHKGKLTAAHQALMTKLQFQENQLLGLAAPEVLDAVPKAKNGPIPFSDDIDDDIPF